MVRKEHVGRDIDLHGDLVDLACLKRPDSIAPSMWDIRTTPSARRIARPLGNTSNRTDGGVSVGRDRPDEQDTFKASHNLQRLLGHVRLEAEYVGPGCILRAVSGS